MLFIPSIRKIGKILRGSASPRQIFLSLFLGVLFGITPGFNLTSILLLMLLLLLNANIGLALIGYAVGKSLCFALAPITFQIGYAVIHLIGLEWLFRGIANTPVLALLDLHVYCLTGGLLVGVLVGSLLGWLAARTIHNVRRLVFAATGASEKVQALISKKPTRFLLWLLFGKQKKPLAELLQAKNPLFRKSGVILVIVVVGGLVVLDLFLLNTIVRTGLEQGLASATGAEADVGNVQLALAHGQLAIDDIQVTDPAAPEFNLVQAKTFEADLNVSDLLTKRLVIDKIRGADLRLHAKRKHPGKVYRRPTPPPESTEKNALDRYFKNSKNVREYLKKGYDYLKKHEQRAKQIKEKQKPTKKQLKERKKELKVAAKNEGYLRLSAIDLLTKHPTWTVREVALDDFFYFENRKAALHASELSSHPELNEKPMSLSILDDKGAPIFAMELHFENPGKPHHIMINAEDIPIADVAGDAIPLAIENGTVSVRADGAFRADALDLPVTVTVHNLKAKAKSKKGVLGMPPETANEIFSNLDHLVIKLHLTGSLENPKVEVDHKALLASLQNVLMKAGKDRLAREATKHAEKLKKKAEEEIKKAVGKKLGSELGGVLGKALKSHADGSKSDGKKKKPEDLLKGLFNK